MPKFSKSFYGLVVVISVLAAITYAYSFFRPASRRARWVNEFVATYRADHTAPTMDPAKCSAVLSRAKAMVGADIRYDPAYYKLDFPGGDVPSDVGVCADVVVRSLRAVGMDLQAQLHEDMSSSFAEYPKLWSLSEPDKNIDHRRVPNLMTYFSRKFSSMPLSAEASDFAPCDIVAWDLGGGVTHIGIVSDEGSDNSAPAMIHHIGGRPSMEYVLFSWRMIGHFRIQSSD